MARQQGLDSERLPYGAPWYETHMVRLEGGVAADGSTGVTGNEGSLMVDEWGYGGEDEIAHVDLL